MVEELVGRGMSGHKPDVSTAERGPGIVSSMRSPRRITPQMQQELQSVSQLTECWMGWSVEGGMRDYGEDLLVKIFDEGSYSGLSFYVQLKSCTDLPKRTKKAWVTYTLLRKDLLHWKDSLPPVVVVLWDVNLREGRWFDVTSILKWLDENNPNWRDVEEPTIKIPSANRCDGDGRDALRTRMAHLALPYIAKQNPGEWNVRITTSFPDGHPDADLMQLSYDEGAPVRLRASEFVKIDFPDWFTRAFGAPKYGVKSSSASGASWTRTGAFDSMLPRMKVSKRSSYA